MGRIRIAGGAVINRIPLDNLLQRRGFAARVGESPPYCCHVASTLGERA